MHFRDNVSLKTPADCQSILEVGKGEESKDTAKKLRWECRVDREVGHLILQIVWFTFGHFPSFL